MSVHEWPMIVYIRKYVSKLISEAERRMGMHGYLYFIKGEFGKGYPKLVFHMNKRQILHKEDGHLRQETFNQGKFN